MLELWHMFTHVEMVLEFKEGRIAKLTYDDKIQSFEYRLQILFLLQLSSFHSHLFSTSSVLNQISSASIFTAKSFCWFPTHQGLLREKQGDGVHNMINIWMIAPWVQRFWYMILWKQASLLEEELFKKTRHILMYVEEFMLSLISKFYVFINMCLFVHSISIREQVDGSVTVLKISPAIRINAYFPFKLKTGKGVK